MSRSDTPANRSQFRGDLARTPLPEVLVTIHQYRAPGVIECIREAETKRIYVEDGAIVFATSTNLFDSLGDYLLRTKRITREQYDENVARLKADRSKRQGAVFVEMGVFEPKDVFLAVREQVQAIVWSLFEWESGSLFFEPGRHKQQETIRLNIPIRQAVLKGVRTIRDAKSLVARTGTKTTVLDRNGDADLSDLGLDSDEQRLLDECNGKKTLFELVKTPPLAPAENAKILYAFSALKLVSRREPKQIKVQVRA